MLASLADLKRHLNITSTANDDELDLILDAAERVVTAIAGEWSGSAVTESVPVVGGTAILSRRPTDVVLTGGSPVGGYVDKTAGVISGLVGYNYWPNQRITVTYTAGGVVPADIELATLIIAAHLWETQRVPGARGESAGPSFRQLPDAVIPLGFAIPSRARELLEPHVRPAIA